MEIILCRHTQTNDNRNRIYSGQNDVELDETGWEQARLLTSKVVRLAGPPIGAVLSSNLLRAVSLAELVGEQVGFAPILHPALREVQKLRAQGVQRTMIVGHGTSFRLVFQYTLRSITQLHDQGEYQLIAWK
jgi:glucosyl-3-phosphoglycerate phosphatase